MWYHVRRKNEGKVLTLTPKMPEVNNGCKYEEGDIPRICVSNTIFNCLRGITGMSNIDAGLFRENNSFGFDGNPAVYITEGRAYTPPNAIDFRQNNEHWVLTEEKYFFLGYVDIYKMLTRKIIAPAKDEIIRLPKKNICVFEEDITERFIERVLK